MPKPQFDMRDFHSPVGATQSLELRRELIELVDSCGGVIFELHPYRHVRVESEPVPSVEALEELGIVIGLGTVSKILAPGDRVGWANGGQGACRPNGAAEN